MYQEMKTLSWLKSIKLYSAFKQTMITFMLLDMKENVKLRRVDKEGVFTYISTKYSHTNIYMEKIYIVYNCISPSFFFGVHPLRRTTASSTSLNVGFTVDEEANA